MADKYIKYKYIGKIFPLNDGSNVEIVDYIDYRDVSIKLETGEIINNIFMSQIKKGILKNPFKRNIFNLGYIGQGKYKSTHKFYKIWYHMFFRCYSPDTYKTYEKCSVCIEWYNFQNFAEWCEKNYVDNYELDKDILIQENKIYSPETCCFVPKEINNLFYSSNYKNEFFGSRKVESGFRPRMQKYGKEIYLGTFKTIDEAFQIYKETKEEYIKEIAEQWKNKINEKVFISLMNFKVSLQNIQ